MILKTKKLMVAGNDLLRGNCRLADEKDFLRQEIENEKKDVVDRLKRENQILRDQLEGTRYAHSRSTILFTLLSLIQWIRRYVATTTKSHLIIISFLTHWMHRYHC